MRSLICLCVVIALVAEARAQPWTERDSLEQVVAQHPHDTIGARALNRLSLLSLARSLDTMSMYAKRALEQSESLHYHRGKAEAMKNLGTAYYARGDYEMGFRHFFEALAVAENVGDKRLVSRILHNIGAAYFYQDDFHQAIEYIKRSLTLAEAMNDLDGVGTEEVSLCECYQRLNRPDQGIRHCNKALEIFDAQQNNERRAYAYHYLAGNYLVKGDHAAALANYRKSAHLVEANNFRAVGIYLFQDIGRYYTELGAYDSAQYYIGKSLQLLKDYESNDALLGTLKAQAALFEARGRYDSASAYYQRLAMRTRDEFNGRRADLMAFIEAHYALEQEQQRRLLSEQELRFNRRLLIAVSITLMLSVLLAIAIYRQYLGKRRATETLLRLNRAIEEQNEEIQAQSEELTQANEEIRLANESLETAVQHRTEEIKKQNQQLREYAFFNAHEVRGPLARILGLVALTKLPEMRPDLEEIMRKLEESAKDLDAVVHEINQKLENKDPQP